MGPAVALASTAALVAGCGGAGVGAKATNSSSSSASTTTVERVSGGPNGTYLVASGIHKIKHVIVIMQENRSFDNYFGTFPGADGIPMSQGVPTVCVPNPATTGCTAPYHDTADVNGGGPHGNAAAIADIDGGKMDGFIERRDRAIATCTNPLDPACSIGSGTVPDVMGYHTAAEIPNY